MPQPASVTDQTFTPFPKLSTEFVDKKGYLSPPWHRFFIALWRKTGGSNVPEIGSVSLVEQSNGSIGAYDQNGVFLGTVALEGATPGIPEPVAATGSPQIYIALVSGLLLVFAAQVELRRGGAGTWYQVTLNGGAIPMRTGDQARITWFSAQAPTITWFPDFAT